MKNRSGTGRKLIIVSFIVTLLTACGGGGGSSNDTPPPVTADTQAPTAKINFPTSQALTTADSITVTGTAVDAQSSAITSVTVNDVAATSDNDFASWRAVVALTAGSNTITVATTDAQGNTSASADSIEIKNEVALLSPSDVEVDANGNRVLLVDTALRALIAVDLTSGVRSILSDDANGTGTASFSAPTGVIVDSANGRALVADGANIIAVDLTSGDRSVLVTLAPAAIAQDIAIDEGGRLLITTFIPGDGTSSPIYKLQTASLTGGPASAADFTPAVTFGGDSSIVVDGSRALVASANGTVTSVDLANGASSPIASTGDNLGDDLVAPLDITLSADGTEAFVAEGGTAQPVIVAIELSTGARTVASGANVGSGGDIFLPEAIATDSAANRSIVLDPILNALLTVAENGDRAILTSADVAGGPAFDGPFNIEYDASNDRALVTDFDGINGDLAAVFTVNLDNGDRSILSGAGTGTGPAFQSLVNLAIDDSKVFVTDIDAQSVFSVDLADGSRTPLVTSFGASRSPLGIDVDTSSNTLFVSVIVADATSAPISSELFSLATTGTTATQVSLNGTGLRFAQNLSIDSTTGTAYIVDTRLGGTDTIADQLLAVTLAGGATSSLGSIEGNTAQQENEIPTQDITLMGNEVVVVDSFQGAMFAIDRETNVKRDISNGTIGKGVALQGPTGVSYDSSRDILLVSDRSSFAVFAVEPNSGDRIIISR